MELRICLYSCSACAGFDCALDSACFRRAGVVDGIVSEVNWLVDCSLGYASSDIGCPFPVAFSCGRVSTVIPPSVRTFAHK